MRAQTTLVLCILLGIAALTLGGCSQTFERISDNETQISADRPNVILVLADDMGWGDVGFNGAEFQTPQIDRLASRSVRLNRAYAFPVCSPTRAALMTGLNPLRFGIDGPMQDGDQLPQALKILPAFFSENGYATWMVGKWHLGLHTQQAMPHNRGFDTYYGHLGGYIDFYTHTYFGGVDWQRNGETHFETGYATELLSDEAVSLIKTHDGTQPFFLYLAYNAPHTPLQIPPGGLAGFESIENPDRRVFAAMMSAMDTGLGRVLDAVDEMGLTETTLIVFIGDNGGNLRAGASNGTLRKGKGTVFEGGVRVPGLISWPGTLDQHTVFDSPVFPQDWGPTLLSASGIEYPEGRFEGLDVWESLLEGEEYLAKAPIVLGARGSFAVYDWPYKLVQQNSSGDQAAPPQLYNVIKDPSETIDLANEKPAQLGSMIEFLSSFPTQTSKATRGPKPEDLFKDEDGRFIHDLRLPETRAPWAEAASDRPASIESKE